MFEIINNERRHLLNETHLCFGVLIESINDVVYQNEIKQRMLLFC